MAKCCRCGAEFDVEFARRSIGQSYGAGVYNNYFPSGDVCIDCATLQVSADFGVGQELMDEMGRDWDD